MNTVAFMTANYVARETGFAMHGWGHGDNATNEYFAPLETYGERICALLADVRVLGFDTVDLWGAHLGPVWATAEHVTLACAALEHHAMRVATYATWIGRSREEIEAACNVATALGTTLIGGGASADAALLIPILRERGVRMAIENHPERTPHELLSRIDAGQGSLAATVDTGWWATQGYDPARAIEDLGERVAHVHLKDVRAVGEPHKTCRWGEGIVDAESCVRALQRLGYEGAIAVEHEPEDHDPGEECRSMHAELEGWLA